MKKHAAVLGKNVKTVGSRSKRTVRADDLLDAAKESAAWNKLILLVDIPGAFRFWNEHLAFRSGVRQDTPLTTDETAGILLLVRTLSWIESRHGTGAGSAKEDPMQCGNPGDPCWAQISGKIPHKDRIIGGPGAPNYWPDDMPGAINPLLSAIAGMEAGNTDRLAEIQNGHGDPGFNPVMSFVWGIVWLVLRMNNGAGGRKAYQCFPVNAEGLKTGAAAYNGGGDPKYGDKAGAVLEMLGYVELLPSKLARALIGFDFDQWNPGNIALPLKTNGATLTSPAGTTKAEIVGGAGRKSLRVPSTGYAIELKRVCNSLSLECTAGPTAALNVELYDVKGNLILEKIFRSTTSFQFSAEKAKLARILFWSNNEAIVQSVRFE